MSEQQVQAMNAGPPAPASGNFLERVKEYWADLQGEMRRVTWPTKEQVQATTAVVIATVFAFSAYFFLVDFVMGQMVTRLFRFFGVAQ